jgi:transcriptional regulator with XRE-family HTH domain
MRRQPSFVDKHVGSRLRVARLEAGKSQTEVAEALGVASFQQVQKYEKGILRGTKPGDIPVEQPTKFDLVVNLKTAKALGLTIPESFLVRADDVIE